MCGPSGDDDCAEETDSISVEAEQERRRGRVRKVRGPKGMEQWLSSLHELQDTTQQRVLYAE